MHQIVEGQALIDLMISKEMECALSLQCLKCWNVGMRINYLFIALFNPYILPLSC